MPPLQVEDLPEAIPIPYRSTAEPDGLDLNSLLIPHPLSTFYMRVRGHRLRSWGVHDGDLLLIDRSIEARPGHLVVVVHGGRFMLRPLVQQGERWQLEPLGPEETPIPLDPKEPQESEVFGVGVRVVHQLLRSKTLTPPQTPQRSPHPADAPGRSSGRRPLRQRRSSDG